MAHHQFRDERGVLWDAWDVYPTLAERRVRDRRIRGALATTRQLPLGRAERRRGERRQHDEPRARLTPDYACGWIVFQAAGERRRLAPVPEHWDEIRDDELRSLCARAAAGPAPRRLIE